MATRTTTHRARKTTHHHRRSHNGHAKDIRNEAEELLAHTLGHLKFKSDDVKGYVSNYVQKQPLKAMGIALIAGAALAFILRR